MEHIKVDNRITPITRQVNSIYEAITVLRLIKVNNISISTNSDVFHGENLDAKSLIPH